MKSIATSVDTSYSLLDRLRKCNDSCDWNLFCDVYQPFIRRHLLFRHVSESDVDDQVQEILSRVYAAFSSFVHNGRPGAFRKWLGTIVGQQAWHYFQGLTRDSQVQTWSPMQMDGQHTIDNPLNEMWDVEHDRYVVNRILELLSREFTETTWRAFQLLAIGNHSPGQVGAMLEMTPNAVMIAKSRVLRRLKMLARDLVDCFEA